MIESTARERYYARPKTNPITNENMGKEMWQTLDDHLTNVAKHASTFAGKFGLAQLAYAAGTLHDLGKATPEFQARLEGSGEKVQHAIHGGIRARELARSHAQTWQVLANPIISHHTGLHDYITPTGETELLERLDEPRSIPQYFNQDIDQNIDIETLSNERRLFISRCPNKPFGATMLVKLLFSCLVDADRLDAYLFDSEEDALAETKADWNSLVDALDERLAKFSCATEMEKLRRVVSESCAASAVREQGIYKLEVPTGGGKTLASLRFALNHAKKHNLDRIIYVIPYLSILSQTAAEIRKALNVSDDIVLEHHSNILPDDERYYKLHTDRWDAPIILTTQVQFLESAFSAKASDLRKFHAMSNSVIIFDEAQSVPIKCVYLFNSLLNFLCSVCGATALLCTATQPLLDKVRKPVKFASEPQVSVKTEPPKRTSIIDKTRPSGYSFDEAAELVSSVHHNSTLIIMNKKDSTQGVAEALKARGYAPLHLSTNMCGAHRDGVIAEIRRRLNAKEDVICVSTQLIEAGVDISFECVVRGIAGLDSLLQAAGRCNRHGEFGETKPVYVINIANENLDKLIDIKQGAEVTERLFREFKGSLTPNAITRYYQYYFFKKEETNEMDYIVQNGDNKGKTLFDMLTANKEGVSGMKNRTGGEPGDSLRPAIRTAGDEFFIIEKGQTQLLVDYGESMTMLDEYLKCSSVPAKRKLLRRLGRYTVSVYEYKLRQLQKQNAIRDEDGVLLLDSAYYNAEYGIVDEGNMVVEIV